ncbi:hypothetical protein Aduo_016037 [Ancylostoma duodenale]
MFVLFPLTAAQNLCADPCGSVCILAYWLLVRVMADGELDDDTIRGIKNVAKTMKLLWHDAAIKLFTLKLHVLVDHAILEDMENTGTPYQWTSAGFEYLHHRLQLRLPQNTTNCEELAVKNFVVRKELASEFKSEVESTDAPPLLRLKNKILEGVTGRFRLPIEMGLGCFCSVPCNSSIEYHQLKSEHQRFLSTYQNDDFVFSSRMICNGKVHSTSYWTRPTNTKQDCVFLCVDDDVNPIFGTATVFFYNRRTLECYVLLDQFHLKDPFVTLVTDVQSSSSQAKERAINTLFLEGRLTIVSDEGEETTELLGSQESVASQQQQLHQLEADEEQARSVSYDEPSSSAAESTPAPSERRLSGPTRGMQRKRHGNRSLMCNQSATLSEKAKELLSARLVPLQDLGRIVSNNSVATEYEELVCEGLKSVRLDIEKIKTVQSSIGLLPSSSDTIVRDLVGNVRELSDIVMGLATVVDSTFVAANTFRNALRTANNNLTKITQMKLPEGASLNAKNVLSHWIVPGKSPFLKKDLKDVIVKWKMSLYYLTQACQPAQSIQLYACRLSGKGARSDRLKDFPENIVDIITNCFLEGMLLGQPELQRTAAELESAPTDFWKSLGSSYRERKVQLEYRQKCRIQWVELCRVAINRAVADVRQYVIKNYRLLPKPVSSPLQVRERN